MAPSYDDERVEHCGLVRDQPVFEAGAEGDFKLEAILDLTFKTIRGESNESVTFEIHRPAGEDPSSWRLSFVPEGVQIVGSGPNAVVRGGPWHDLDANLVFIGWGYLHSPTTKDLLLGPCRIISPPYREGASQDDFLPYQCQLQPTDVDPTSEAGKFYDSLR
jgi:hypothetical protein